MSADLRGFIYPLEALRRKQQWLLDQTQSRLAAAQSAVDKARCRLADIEREHARVAADCASVALARIDPATHIQGLACLTALNAQAHQVHAELLDAIEARDALRKECTVRQQRVELGNEHRRSCLEEYRDNELRREAVEADRDWIARSHLPVNSNRMGKENH